MQRPLSLSCRYSLEWRVQQAATLLRTTPDRIECIAADTGFTSSTLFERAFRTVMGMTPTAYRLRMRAHAV